MSMIIETESLNRSHPEVKASALSTIILLEHPVLLMRTICQ